MGQGNLPLHERFYVDNQKTLDWLKASADEAMTEARNGNTGLLNRMGRNSALQHYINNVHTRQVMTPEQWSQNYYPYMMEADRLREEYDALQEAVAISPRIASLESKFDELKAMILGMTESQKSVPGADIRTKSNGKPKAEPTEPAAEGAADAVLEPDATQET